MDERFYPDGVPLAFAGHLRAVDARAPVPDGWVVVGYNAYRDEYAIVSVGVVNRHHAQANRHPLPK